MLNRKRTIEMFINDSCIKHNNKYNYHLIKEYKGGHHKYDIICPEHGIFNQWGIDHLKGCGCPKCGRNKPNYNLKDYKLYTDNPVDVYIIELYNDTERFLKVGISKEVNKRLKNIKTKSGYNFKKLLFLQCTLREAVLIEDHLQSFKNIKYTPSIKFPGYTECFKIEAKQKELLNNLKTFLIEKENKSPLVGKILDYIYGK